MDQEQTQDVQASEGPSPKKRGNPNFGKRHADSVMKVDAPVELQEIRGRQSDEEYQGSGGVGGLEPVDMATREEVERSMSERSKGTRHRYVSHKHNFTLYISTPVKHENGNFVFNDQGRKVFDTQTLRFTNGAYFTDNDEIASTLESHPAYGGSCVGRKETLTPASEPLFWKGTFPTEVWKALQSERKYLTIDDEMYEKSL